MQAFRVFVSSPSDVMVERRRVENVVSRLNGEFAGVARLDAIRWETEAYQAHSTFQAQIPHSTECDLVIGILKWRLGTALPDDFDERLANGEPFPSGTAYEILTAIEKRQKGEKLPDIYVFRFAGSSPSVAVEDPDRVRIEHDWQVLKGFFQEWFLTEHGQFKAAFNPYASEDDFEAQLEKLLRKWVADKVAGGRVVRWPIAVKGSPFRGLAAFGAKHAPVFFGRSHDTARALDLWREAGGRGSPYLLVVGASGAGKSSLARAGLLPRLTTPGVIKQVDVWRVAVMRPGDSPAGPVAALAAALMQDEAGLPKEEEGRGVALPEIAQGDSQTPAELAAVLLNADTGAAIKPVINALSRVATAERTREGYSRDVRCDLVLLIDQLDELFAASVGEPERTGFIDLIAALVATGRIWVAATLRADFYASMLDQSGLKKLKELGATYDLAPPGAVELAETVRSPAEAAGLVFETDAATGVPLDARLLSDADRPDMLPLVQLALSRLFEAREAVGDEIRLPLSTYNSLGGLKGIIDEAGETALASLGDAEKALLPRLLRQLAVPAHEQDGIAKGVLTVRAVPLAQAAPDDASRKLVDALVTARLLTTTSIAADTQGRLAHQRVLEDWSRARTIVADSADFYRIRADVEESRRKWDAGNRRGELLLVRGLPLAEAESIVEKYRDELTPDILAYVRASRTRADRAQIFAWGAAAVFLLVAIGAVVAAIIAVDRTKEADAARLESKHDKETVNLIYNLVPEFKRANGMQPDTLSRVQDMVPTTTQQSVLAGSDDPQLSRSRAIMLGNSVNISIVAGDLKDAAAKGAQGLAIFRNLAAQAQADLAWSLDEAREVKLQDGDWTGALAAAQESLDIRRKLATQNQGNAQAQADLALSLNRVGEVKLKGGDWAKALAAAQESLDIVRKLTAQDQGNAQMLAGLASSLDEVAEVKLQGGDWAGALAAAQESLDIRRKLLAQSQGSSRAQRDVSLSLIMIGELKAHGSDFAGALAAYRESLEIGRKLAGQNAVNAQALHDVPKSLHQSGEVKPHDGDQVGASAAHPDSRDGDREPALPDEGDAQAQRDVLRNLNGIGDVEFQQGDQTAALAAYQESRDIARKLAARAADSAQARRDVSLSLNGVGDVKLRRDDRAAARAAYQESLDIARALATQDQGNAEAQRELSLTLNKVGDARLQDSDRTGALAAYQESLDIVRKLAVQDAGNARAQADLVVTLYEVSRAGDAQQARAVLTESLSIAEILEREQKLTARQKNLPEMLRGELAKLR